MSKTEKKPIGTAPMTLASPDCAQNGAQTRPAASSPFSSSPSEPSALSSSSSSSSSPPSSSSSSSAATAADPSYYTWANLFKVMIGEGGPEARQKYIRAKDLVNEKRDCDRCEGFRDKLFQKSPIIRFLRDEIAKIGPDLGPSSVHCRRCTTSQTGGFDLDHGILLCANELPTKSRAEDTLAHELVHAYDWARWHVDRHNMRHQACTEIRASMLSGECRFMREVVGRGQYKITGQFGECVRRRATLSVMARPEVAGDRKKAEAVVDDVWESCFRDTRPFDEIFR